MELTEEQKSKLKWQVEFYFSDSNLPKDAFLLGQVQKHPEGYVDLSVVCAFTRMRDLLKLGEVSPEDVPDDAILAVADVLRGSASGLLAVSDSGYQVKRVTAIPSEAEARKLVDERSLYVRPFPMFASLDAIVGFFRQAGVALNAVRLRRHARSRAFKGSAFLECSDADEAARVAGLSLAYEGAPLRCERKRTYLGRRMAERKRRRAAGLLPADERVTLQDLEDMDSDVELPQLTALNSAAAAAAAAAAAGGGEDGAAAEPASKRSRLGDSTAPAAAGAADGANGADDADMAEADGGDDDDDGAAAAAAAPPTPAQPAAADSWVPGCILLLTLQLPHPDPAPAAAAAAAGGEAAGPAEPGGDAAGAEAAADAAAAAPAAAGGAVVPPHWQLVSLIKESMPGNVRYVEALPGASTAAGGAAAGGGAAEAAAAGDVAREEAAAGDAAGEDAAAGAAADGAGEQGEPDKQAAAPLQFYVRFRTQEEAAAALAEYGDTGGDTGSGAGDGGEAAAAAAAAAAGAGGASRLVGGLVVASLAGVGADEEAAFYARASAKWGESSGRGGARGGRGGGGGRRGGGRRGGGGGGRGGRFGGHGGRRGGGGRGRGRGGRGRR